MDVCAYAAHLAALVGAHIIKVKLPSDHLEQPDAKKVYEASKIDISTQAKRVEHVMQSVFNGRRLVVFSGGAKPDASNVHDQRSEERRVGKGGVSKCRSGW